MKTIVFRFFISGYVSILINVIISLATYFFTLQNFDFKLGFPKHYYQQFCVDGTLHHRVNGNNLLFDELLISILVIGTWCFF